MKGDAIMPGRDCQRRRATKERPVIYRGIKIMPIIGKRSKLAQYIHDALKDRAKDRGHDDAETR